MMIYVWTSYWGIKWMIKPFARWIIIVKKIEKEKEKKIGHRSWANLKQKHEDNGDLHQKHRKNCLKQVKFQRLCTLMGMLLSPSSKHNFTKKDLNPIRENGCFLFMSLASQHWEELLTFCLPFLGDYLKEKKNRWLESLCLAGQLIN